MQLLRPHSLFWPAAQKREWVSIAAMHDEVEKSCGFSGGAPKWSLSSFTQINKEVTPWVTNFSQMARQAPKQSFTGHFADIGLDLTGALDLGYSFPAIW